MNICQLSIEIWSMQLMNSGERVCAELLHGGLNSLAESTDCAVL